MSKRRSRGDGGLYWSERRQRWIAEVTVGYDGRGKRITRKASGRTKTEAKAKLKEILNDIDDGLSIAPTGYTVADAVQDWLTYALNSHDEATVAKLSTLARIYVIPAPGARKLRELTAEDVDQWLAAESKSVSTRTLQDLRSILKRAITRAQARDKVKRNVVLLCELPKGQTGRPSKFFNLDQTEAMLAAAETFATAGTFAWLARMLQFLLLTEPEPKKCGRCAGLTLWRLTRPTGNGGRSPRLDGITNGSLSMSGGRCAPPATRKPGNLGARSACRSGASVCFANTRNARPPSRRELGHGGKTASLCSPPLPAASSIRTLSSERSARS